jgi:leucyl aminopeptidase
MKCDMAGGAVFGAMQLIADLQLPVKSPLLFHVQKMLSTQKHFAK